MALSDADKSHDEALTREGLKGLVTENTFAGVASAFRRSYRMSPEGVDLAILGAPFDQAVTNRPGARLGPRAIREASALQPYDPPYGWDGLSPFETVAIADMGDVAFDYAQPATFPVKLQERVAQILGAGAGLITLGGDHSITLPLLRAHHAVHGPLALIQFDAHTDTWPDDDPTRVDHGTFAYKAVRDGLIDPARSVHVGIRTVVADNLGIAILDTRWLHDNGPAAAAARVKEIVGDAPAYLSFDIDCLDPAFAPGTGTPVWGGLSSREAAILLGALSGVAMVGGDVVEVSPPYDPAGITAVAGAHVAMELICLWTTGRRRG